MYCTAPLSPRKGRLRSFRDDDDDDVWVITKELKPTPNHTRRSVIDDSSFALSHCFVLFT